ncbi:MAG: histidine kinase with domain [Deltaproteobacteria bacterium]|nr:histidine kinase with domain [Deltaproteobacteria bacterium]
MNSENEQSDLIVCERALGVSERKLSSMLELGRLIGLDLNIDDMLVQIAQKAREVMDADRFNLFLYDPVTDELWTRILLEIEGKECRIPAHMGIAGYSFRTGKTIIVDDVRKDPRFFSYIDEITGYTTRNMLCMPFCSRSGSPLGVMQLINKLRGHFTAEDESLLTLFTNHASVFIEIAQLQKARLESLEQSRKELERLNIAKGKALDHLSHELKTPLAVIQGYLRIMKRKIERLTGDASLAGYFDILKRHMERLFEVQKECERIIQAYRETEQENLVDELEHLWKKLEGLQTEIPLNTKELWQSLKDYIAAYIPPDSRSESVVILYPVVEKAIADTRANAAHRDIEFALTGDRHAAILMDSVVLKDMLMGLLKNAVENTPDGGRIEVMVNRNTNNISISVTDYGTGITETNQPHIFEGFFHTQDTDLYRSRKLYDFGAGGKGLDLFQMKVYARRFGFDISMTSSRCIYIPTDSDLCPGKISLCRHISGPKGCMGSGATTFCLTFPVSKEYLKIDTHPKAGI